MASKDLDVEMMETKVDQTQQPTKTKIKRSNTSKHASVAAQEKSNADLRQAYEHRKAMIPILQRWNNITFYVSMLGIVLTLTEIELSRHYYKNVYGASLIPLVIKIAMTVSTIFW